MAANVQRSLRHFPAYLFQYAPFHIFARQRGLALAPDLDAFEQSAAGIVARLSHRQHGIQVDMRIDEGGRNQPTGSINFVCRTVSNIRRDASELPILNSDIDQSRLAVQSGMTNDE